MTTLRESVFRRKEELIQRLLDLGVYKKEGQHLYELTLTEVEIEYCKEMKRRKLIS
ncbi:Fur-regulated basic protein FbpA [Halalkalibacter kiskunsagensis]|uniref:Fur-regulated basic protein FbpA n=1 Tax=Halalkalibacter kiskunsagensis TaxID=1548599 RepID=A0ABV6KFD9_9BACI